MPSPSHTDISQAHGLYRGRARFGSLDGLRFICIAAVLWHHSPVLTAISDPATILQRGFLGVDFFFVLSGFLITTLLLREEQREGSFSLSGFYIRRARRILPVYFLVVAIAAGWFIIGKGETRYLEALPAYIFFLANFLTEPIPLLAPTWSLAVEEQYYLVWPLLLLILPRRAILPVLAALILINLVGIMGGFAPLGIRSFDWGPFTFALPNATYAPILIGSALAILMQNRSTFATLYRLFGHRWSAPVLLALVIALAAVLPTDLRGLPNLALHLAMAATLASLTLREDNALAPILQWHPLARVGETSYGIYLYHLFALHVAHLVLGRLGVESPGITAIAYALLSIAVAEISFRTLEAWFRPAKPHTTKPA
jgi:peptidoglycan/LPS O-acetylase OafA/YrhL